MLRTASPFALNYLRVRSDEMMVSECVIVRPSPTQSPVVLDPVSRKAVVSDGAPVYTGVCRMWQVSSGNNTWEQDREVAIATTYLSLPHGAVAEPNDLVLITADNDPALVGRSLTVEAVTRGGGLRGSRVMRVQFNDYSEEGDS